ncbi:choice-of-anchor Q domain-containing protein, partial [Chloroflexus sp.]|uniref:choice-of-anchor Q domain-containing protein n=1 Tax=Chloroflexus sp. TaxID=1904827 RepID=UPI003C7675C7
MALLLMVLSLTTAVTLTAPRIVRANPGVLYAAPTAQGSGDCSGWPNACTLQTALAQAVSGDEIWVQAGVHYPGAAGNRTATFTLKSGVAVYGGFAGTESNRDERDWQANLTILSGDIDQNDINTDGNYIAETWNDIQGENAYHVVTASSVDSTAVLDGFIVTAGYAAVFSHPHFLGGGMYTTSSSLTVTRVIFSGNRSAGAGGGMFNEWDSSLVLTNVTFAGNRSGGGGGGMGDSGSYLNSVAFNGNTADAGGGGMLIARSPTLLNVTFNGNHANGGGGGIRVNFTNSSPMLINVVFTNNTTNDRGGGIYNLGTPTIINATLSNNVAALYGGGIYNYNDASPTTLRNVIIWGNTASSSPSIYNRVSPRTTISYSDIQGCGGSGNWQWECGNNDGGNIDADPLFVDAANGNVRLQLTSPAIDAGDNTAVPSGITTDLDGNPRFVNIPTVPDTGNGSPLIVDMGAYEAQDIISPSVLSINRASPNPTNAASVELIVTFSEPVTGVDNGDFSLFRTGSISGAGVTGLSGSGATYTVTVDTGTGSGTLRMDVPETATLSDLNGNPLSSLPYTGGEVYDVDKTAPTVLSITRASPSPTNAPSVDFTVTFSEDVAGVDVPDFALTSGGNLVGANITGVSGSGAVYTVTASTGSGNGTLRLDISGTASIYDAAGNLLTGLPYTDGQFYTIDKTPPTVDSILRADPNPTNAESVRFLVSFSEDVSGVETADFTVTIISGDIYGASVSEISGPGMTYTVTVSTGTGPGVLRLDVPVTAAVTDLAGNALSGLPYTSGETYTLNRAQVFYAASTAQGSGDCFGWANACTLQTALAQAQSGDEIWVKAGVHYPGAAGNRT